MRKSIALIVGMLTIATTAGAYQVSSFSLPTHSTATSLWRSNQGDELTIEVGQCGKTAAPLSCQLLNYQGTVLSYSHGLSCSLTAKLNEGVQSLTISNSSDIPAQICLLSQLSR
jgi:hypothetical protein